MNRHFAIAAFRARFGVAPVPMERQEGMTRPNHATRPRQAVPDCTSIGADPSARDSRRISGWTANASGGCAGRVFLRRSKRQPGTQDFHRLGILPERSRDQDRAGQNYFIRQYIKLGVFVGGAGQRARTVQRRSPCRSPCRSPGAPPCSRLSGDPPAPRACGICCRTAGSRGW